MFHLRKLNRAIIISRNGGGLEPRLAPIHIPFKIFDDRVAGKFALCRGMYVGGRATVTACKDRSMDRSGNVA